MAHPILAYPESPFPSLPSGNEQRPTTFRGYGRYPVSEHRGAEPEQERADTLSITGPLLLYIPTLENQGDRPPRMVMGMGGWIGPVEIVQIQVQEPILGNKMPPV